MLRQLVASREVDLCLLGGELLGVVFQTDLLFLLVQTGWPLIDIDEIPIQQAARESAGPQRRMRQFEGESGTTRVGGLTLAF